MFFCKLVSAEWIFFYDLSHNLGLENAALFSDSVWLSYFIFLGCALSSRVFAFAKLVLSKLILQKKTFKNER